MSTRELKSMDAAAVKDLLASGKAVLIDIREEDEHARAHIPGARLLPLSRFNPAAHADDQSEIGVFHCESGTRTAAEAARILQTGFREVYQLEGGLKAWRAAGLPATVNARAPISIMRQVQITAGGLVVAGAILALTVSPWFIGLSGFVGAGLMFAGLTGTCAMATLLSAMPWNKTSGIRDTGATASANA